MSNFGQKQFQVNPKVKLPALILSALAMHGCGVGHQINRGAADIKAGIMDGIVAATSGTDVLNNACVWQQNLPNGTFFPVFAYPSKNGDKYYAVVMSPFIVKMEGVVDGGRNFAGGTYNKLVNVTVAPNPYSPNPAGVGYGGGVDAGLVGFGGNTKELVTSWHYNWRITASKAIDYTYGGLDWPKACSPDVMKGWSGFANMVPPPPPPPPGRPVSPYQNPSWNNPALNGLRR